MLDARMQLHREFLLAHAPGQKLFVTLHVSPDEQAVRARPNLSVVFVVDTSGSMREVVTEVTEHTGQTTFVDGQRYEVVRGGKTSWNW